MTQRMSEVEKQTQNMNAAQLLEYGEEIVQSLFVVPNHAIANKELHGGVEAKLDCYHRHQFSERPFRKHRITIVGTPMNKLAKKVLPKKKQAPADPRQVSVVFQMENGQRVGTKEGTKERAKILHKYQQDANSGDEGIEYVENEELLHARYYDFLKAFGTCKSVE